MLYSAILSNMFKSTYNIAKVWGIPIRANISLFVILIAFAVNTAQIGGPIAIPLGLFIGIMLFTSIALHELGHSFVAIKKGCKVRSITLAIFGGVASMESVPSKPKDELLMAVAGPLVSLTIAGTGYLASSVMLRYDLLILQMLGSSIELIALLNLILAIFNLLPAFPMDGGRVLRAILTPYKGKLRATYIASRIGKTLAMLFGFWGLSAFFLEGDSWGILRILVAVFIYTGAENEYKLVRLQEAAKWSFYGDSDAQDDIIADFDSVTDTDESDNEVEISPPPYDQGPGIRSKVHNTDEDNPFTNMFKR